MLTFLLVYVCTYVCVHMCMRSRVREYMRVCMNVSMRVTSLLLCSYPYQPVRKKSSGAGRASAAGSPPPLLQSRDFTSFTNDGKMRVRVAPKDERGAASSVMSRADLLADLERHRRKVDASLDPGWA